MLCIYGFSLIGTSALMLGASSVPAQARGGGRGGGGAIGGGGDVDEAFAVLDVQTFGPDAFGLLDLHAANTWEGGLEEDFAGSAVAD